MNTNYPEYLFEQLKRGCFPTAEGEELKRLKIAFLQGMHSGREVITQALDLDEEDAIKCINELRQQVEGSLSQLGQKPGKIRVFTAEPSAKVTLKINGEQT